jgi:hypothetical protein
VRLLVCGGRSYADEARLVSALEEIHATHPISCVIHGASTGADAIADRWAVEHRIGVARFQAHWEIEGRAAGPLRNKRMLREGRPDLVVAFPGGRGTADMVRQAKAFGVPVVEVDGGPR